MNFWIDKKTNLEQKIKNLSTEVIIIFVSDLLKKPETYEWQSSVMPAIDIMENVSFGAHDIWIWRLINPFSMIVFWRRAAALHVKLYVTTTTTITISIKTLHTTREHSTANRVQRLFVARARTDSSKRTLVNTHST